MQTNHYPDIQGQQFAEPMELAQYHAEFFTELALEQHFLHLDTTAQQISDGKVLCLDCNDEIPAARLAALPHCTRCIDCQTLYELD